METPAGQPCRIGFVTSELLPVTRGGAGVLLAQACAELLRRGHRVHVLLDAPPQACEAFRREHQPALPNPGNLRLWGIGELTGDDALTAPGTASWYERKSRHWHAAAEAMLAHADLDVLEFPDFYGFGHQAIAAHRWLGRHPRTRFVVRAHTTMETLQSHEIGCYVERHALLMHEQERAAIRAADAVLVPSASYGRWLREAYALPAERVVVSPPPVRFDNAFRPAPPGPRDTVLFIGRLFHVKGADTFVDAAVHLLEGDPPLDPAARFVLLGYDSNMAPGLTSFEQYLRRRIPARLAERFAFPGQVDPPQVAAWLARSLCYVCPSRTESFGYTVHEAAACGVPLVLADLPAFADHFRDGQSCLAFDGSAADLARQIGRLARDAALRERLASAARNSAPAPLGEAYETLAAQAREAEGAPAGALPTGESLLAVVFDDGTRPPAGDGTAAVLREALPAARVVVARVADGAAAHTAPLLGRLWTFDAPPVSLERLLLCAAGDRMEPEFLRGALAALDAEPGLGFVAPTPREPPQGPPLELELPAWPLEQEQAMTRCLLRTPPGMWLSDLFDRRLDAYAEIGLLWSLHDQGLAGVQWPWPCADLAAAPAVLDDRAVVQSMLLRNANRRRADLLARLAAQAPAPTTPALTLDPPPRPAWRRMAGRIRRRLRGLLRYVTGKP